MSSVTPQDLLAAVDTAVSQWRSSRTMRDETLAPLIKLVWNQLRNRLSATPPGAGRWFLSDDQLTALGQDIDAAYASVERQLAAKHMLNDLLYLLNQRGFVRSKYLNAPTQVPRRLVWSPEIEDASLFGLLETLRDRVEQDRPPRVPPGWPFSLGLWQFLLAIMAMALSSHVVLPTLPRRLLDVCRRDLANGWLALSVLPGTPAPGTVKLRFPLTRSTQRHLHRLLASFPRRRGRPRAADLLLPRDLREEAARHFPRAWRVALTSLAPDAERHRQLHSFRQFSRTARWLALLADIPPFLVAVLSGELAVAPVTTASFLRCFGMPFRSSRGGRKPPRPPRAALSPDIRLFYAIETIRRSVRRDATRAEIAQAAHTLQSVLDRLMPTTDALTFNVRCYGLWVLHLLTRAARGRPRPGTVNTRASAVATRFAPTFAMKPFTTWQGDDWLIALQARMLPHRTTNVRTAVKQFRDFLVERRLAPSTPVAWNHRSLRKPPVARAYPLVTFDDFDRAFHLPAAEGVPVELHDIVKAKMVLGFGLGVRSEAATQLRLGDFTVEGEFMMTIRRDKTYYGRRSIPLKQLLTPPYLEFLRDFYVQRRAAERGRKNAYLLSTPGHGRAYDPSYLASLTAVFLTTVVPEPLSFHDLRHAFASWFLVRALVATGAVTLPPVHGFAQASVFQASALEALRELVLGFHASTRGHETVSHYVVVLSFLLGHSNPETTLMRYCHTAELILWLLQDPQARPAPPGHLGS